MSFNAGAATSPTGMRNVGKVTSIACLADTAQYLKPT
jgi:hypothetical protein